MPSRKKVDDRIIRRYKNYSDEKLSQIVSEIHSGKISLNKASIKYGISKGTLSHKINKKHVKNVGRSRLLSLMEEQIIVKHVITVSEWGFPFTQMDLCQLTKLYLNKSNRQVSQFKNNMPSVQWARRFLKQYKLNVSLKYCQNIKRSKAGLTEEVMQQYFDNLKDTLTNDDGTMVPPENVFNYDETNLSDDPGVKKCIFKRGVKYPERICDTSKASTSLMFCGSAIGKMLPPYVVYKAKHLYPTWMDGGPSDTRYNRSKSGWFDSAIFADWFASMFVPYVRKQKLVGKIVVIGDNLTSHFSEEVLSLCASNNIAFVCLPTNSTHMTQPLDVAFYAPLKKSWRGILDEWKKGLQKKCQTITKESFPGLLKKLHQHVTNNDTSSKNLVAGFKKCGIYPLNSSEVIDRLPKYNEAENISENVSLAVIDMLQDLRNGVCKQTKTRRRKIDVQPGKSVSVEDILQSQPTDDPTSSGEMLSSGEHRNSGEDSMEEVDSEEDNVPSTRRKATKRKKAAQTSKPKKSVKKGEAEQRKSSSIKSKPKKSGSNNKRSPGNQQSLPLTNESHSSTTDADAISTGIEHSQPEAMAVSTDHGGAKVTTGFVHNVRLFDFVIVEFFVSQTKRFKYFIAKVVQVNSDFHKVIFLQHHKSRFFFPDFMEERNVLTTQVRKILTAPMQKGDDVLFNKTEIGDFNFK